MTVSARVTATISIPPEVTENKTKESIDEGMLRGTAIVAREAFSLARTISVSGPGGKVFRAWDTGTFARSIGHAVSPQGESRYGKFTRMGGDSFGNRKLSGASAKGVQGIVSTSTWRDVARDGYGSYVELGTSIHPARFVILTAVQNKEQEFMAQFDETMKDVPDMGQEVKLF